MKKLGGKWSSMRRKSPTIQAAVRYLKENGPSTAKEIVANARLVNGRPLKLNPKALSQHLKIHDKVEMVSFGGARGNVAVWGLKE